VGTNTVGTRIQGNVVIVETPIVYPEMPLRVEYKLTEKASRLRPILEQMGEFSARFCATDMYRDKRPRGFKQVLDECFVQD